MRKFAFPKAVFSFMVPDLNSRKSYYILLFSALALTLLPMLLFLDVHSIRLWDESRQAYSAAYMLFHKNYLVTYFRNEPDLWNTKPPLLVWLQMLSMGIFGVTEFAARFPILIAALLTVWLVFWFGWNILKMPLAIVFAVLVLIGSRGYMGHHIALTGDYDALLTFFITIYSVFFFLYLEKPKEKYWFFIVLALILGAYTKGVATLLPLPALALYAIFSKKIFVLLRSKGLYLSVPAFIIAVGSFYYWREQVSPGYWQAVHENELGGRFLKTLEEHNKPWYYFFLGGKFSPWLFLLPVCLYFIYKMPAGIAKRFSVFAFCFYAVLLLIISSARTKLPWYDAPVYPFISLLVGIGLNQIYERLNQRFPRKQKLVTGFYALLLLIPYGLIAANAAKQDRKDQKDSIAAIGYFLNDFNARFPEIKKYTTLTTESYHAPLDFYLLKYSQEGDEIEDRRVQNLTKDLKPGQVILSSEAALKDSLLAVYQVKTLHETQYGFAIEITGTK